MKAKPLMSFVIICLLMFTSVSVKVKSSDLPLAASVQDIFLWGNVYASEEVRIGEEFSVVFEIRPLQFENVDVDYVEVNVYGRGIGWKEWNYSWDNMIMEHGVTYTETAHLSAVADGFVSEYIRWRYFDSWGEVHVLTANFGIAQVHAKPYEELETDYNSLNQSYLTLKTDYKELESRYNIRTSELSTAWRLSLLLTVTTIVFIATTAMLYVTTRKPKVKQS